MTRDVQLRHVCVKLVPLETSSKGKVASELQLRQQCSKLVPLDKSKPSAADGNEVRLLHKYQTYRKVVPLDKSTTGKEVSEEQPNQVSLK